MAISWKDLYGANWSRRLGGGGNKWTQGALAAQYDQIMADTVRDYERLSGSGGGGGGAPAPRMIPAPPPLATPTTSSAGGASFSKGGRFGGPRFGLPVERGVELPVYDQEKVEALAQRFAAPGVRSLRSAIQDTQQAHHENPNVGAMTVRQALQGYGQGLEEVMAGALKSGISAYGHEYNPLVQKALTEYSAREERERQRERLASEERIARGNRNANLYSRAYDDYLKSLQ